MRRNLLRRVQVCEHCAIKGREVKATYLALTAHGYWAYLCRIHFVETNGQLGKGKGRLIT